MEKRTLKELERRLALTLARSFGKIEFLEWSSTDRFSARINVQAKEPNTLLVVLDYKGSALVKLDGKPYWSLDGYHKSMHVPIGNHELTLEFTPFQAFGERTRVSLGVPVFTIRNEDAYKFWNYCFMILGFAKQTKDKEVADDLFDVLSRSFNATYFESVTHNQLVLASHLTQTFPRELTEVIPKSSSKELEATGYRYEDDPEKWKRGILVTEEGLAKLVRKYGKRGEIVGIAHGHIDTAWLWHFTETEKKVSRTFSVVSTLLQDFGFHYMQSMAIYYDWTKRNQPELYEKVKEFVKKGIWELGAGWVENDANILSGESFARQFLYSQRFYLNEFGRLAKVYWLPDTFGFAASIPQIAKLGGARVFATQKVFWNDTNSFPYSVFSWIGIDGTSIPSIAFGHAKDGYNSEFALDELTDQWANWTEKDRVPMLYSFGHGDGGGGPTEEMLIRAGIVNSLPILPKVKLDSTSNSSLSYIEQNYSQILSPKFLDKSNKWRGEIYAEFHRGVLTSHTKIKHLNRRAEIALREAELWSSLGKVENGTSPSQKDELTLLWKTVLKHQFHDVLPGSAINEVYVTAYEELESVISRAEEIADRSRKEFAQGQASVFNSLPWNREEYVIMKEQLVKGSQKVEGGFLTRVRAPSVGFSPIHHSIVQTTEAKVTIEESEKHFFVENKCFKIMIDKSDGSVTSIFDKEAKRELLKAKSNTFAFYENMPGWADAWDIEKGYKVTSFDAVQSDEPFRIIESGPSRVRLKLGTKRFRHSSIEQEVIFCADSRRIDFKTWFDMHDRELLLKAWFHFNINSDKATYEIPFGNIEQKVTSNTPWESAMFEVPMQKWVDFSEGEYGVAILNDGKYGISAEHGSFGISVVRTPMYPDYATDSEPGSFTFSIYPHERGWREAEIPRRAYELNVPIKVVEGGAATKSPTKENSFVRIDSRNLMLEGIKQSEDGSALMIRLYEMENKRGEARIEFPWNISSAKCVDILELSEVDSKATFSENRVIVQYLNYQILTLMVEFQKR